MSDADKDFKIRISDEGIAETGAKVDALARKTEQLAQATEKLSNTGKGLATSPVLGDEVIKKRQNALRQAEEDNARIAQSLQDGMERNNASKPNAFAQQIEESTRAATSAAPKINGLSMAISRVGRMFGLSGIRGGAAMFTLIGSAATLAYLAFSKVAEVIKVIGDVATPSLEPLVDKMEDIREKTFELEAAQRSYYRELQRVASMPETESSKAAARMRSLQEASRFEEQMANQQQQRDLTNLDALEEAGIISHQEALRRKFALDEEYNAKKIALEKKAIDDEIQNKISERDADQSLLKGSADGKTKGLTYQLADAQNAQMATQAREDLKKAQLEQMKQARAATINRIETLQQKVQDNDLKIQLPGNRDKIRKILESQIDAEQSDLSALGPAIAKQIGFVQNAEESNNKAKESMNALKSQVDELTGAIRKLNLEIGHDQGLAGQKKNDLAVAAEAAHQAAVAKAIDDRAKLEKAQGITPGGAGSALMFDRAQKAAWDSANQSQRAGMTPPSLHFNPNAVDPATGQPINPAQPRHLNPWEPGAQQQYDRQRYNLPDPKDLPAQIKPLADQYMEHWKEVTTGVINGQKASVQALKDVRDNMLRELATIHTQMKALKNHGGIS